MDFPKQKTMESGLVVLVLVWEYLGVHHGGIFGMQHGKLSIDV